MRAGLLCALCGIGTLPMMAQEPSSYFWKPDPQKWRLELLTPLGGWSREGVSEIRVQLMDPTEVRPAKELSLDYWERWQKEREARARAIRQRVEELLAGEPEARWQPETIGGEGWSKDPDEEEAAPTEDLSLLAKRLKAERQAREELRAVEEARRQNLKVWFNGEALVWPLELNRQESFEIRTVQGENRLEILEPESGLREVRTWWCESRAPRLRVIAREPGARWTSSNLEVLEPGGKLASGVQDFEKSHPASGTYTLRWNAGAFSRWWSPEDAQPRTVEVNVILDGGTDRERRWRFESLVLPGTGAVLIGSFDVED